MLLIWICLELLCRNLCQICVRRCIWEGESFWLANELWWKNIIRHAIQNVAAPQTFIIGRSESYVIKSGKREWRSVLYRTTLFQHSLWASCSTPTWPNFIRFSLRVWCVNIEQKFVFEVFFGVTTTPSQNRIQPSAVYIFFYV